MSGLLKATMMILGLLLAAAALVGLALAWTERTSQSGGQMNLETPENVERPAATPVDAGPDTDTSVRTATFALG